MVALPEKFADLSHWGPEWSKSWDRDRHVQRVGSDLETVRGFYEAVFPRMEAIIAYLNTKPNDPAKLDEPDRNLFYLALTCMEMSHPIDMKWKSTDIDDTFPWQRMEFR
jgi:hypothetical protein